MAVATIKELMTYTELLKDNFDLAYADSLTKADNWASRFCDMNVGIHGYSVRFPFLLEAGGIRLSKEGEPPDYETLLGDSTEISVQKFDKGFTIPCLQFSDPYWQSMYMKRVNGASVQMAYLPLQRLCNALNYGDTDSYYTVWDGEQMFSASHTINGHTYSNLTTGTLTETNFITVKTNMMRIPWGKDNYEYLEMDGASWTLIVPPDLAFTAKKLLKNSWDASDYKNTENVIQGEADILVSNRLIDSNDWFLVATLPGYNPFIHIENDEIGNRQLIDENENWKENVKRDSYQWFTKTWEEVFPANWYLITKVVNSGGTV